MNDRKLAVIDEIAVRTGTVEPVLEGKSERRGQRGSIPADFFDLQFRRSCDLRDAIAQVLRFLAQQHDFA